MSEPRYLVAVAYRYTPPGVYRLDGWSAFAEMCEAVKNGRAVRVRGDDFSEASWHPERGWQRADGLRSAA